MVRAAIKEDTLEITGIYNHYILNSVASFETEAVSCDEMERRRREFSRSGPFLVYTDDKGKVRGYAYVHPWKERAAYHLTFETTVYVHPECLHTGIATALMREMIRECRKLPIHALIACITGGNTPSTGLHEKLGFRKVSEFREVGEKFGRVLDVVDYELIL